LLGGNHAHIDRWRRDRALEKTKKRRPDLLQTAQLSPRDRSFLDETSL
jgi:tRNA (guanine37-N1)-methyltransferase